MDRIARIEEVRRYIEAYYIPDEFENIVVDQEPKGILGRSTELRGKGVKLKRTAREIFTKKASPLRESSPVCDEENALDDACMSMEESHAPESDYMRPMRQSISVNRSLDDLMSQLDETFSERLLRMIYDRDLVEAEVYKRACVDRRHFAKIKKDKYYSPNKKTVLAFAIALKLSVDETKDLLASAGYALSRSSKFDIIVTYFLENKIYDMYEINDVLFAYEQPVF